MKRHPCFCVGLKKRNKHHSKLAERTDLPVPNALDFEAVKSLKLLSQERHAAILEIKNLHKNFESGREIVHAVNGLNVKLYQGQIFALLGHNGAGKTTTIQMLTGVLEPSSGLMQFLGCDMQREREMLQTKIGVCPQENILFDLLTVYQHSAMFLSLKNVGEGSQ